MAGRPLGSTNSAAVLPTIRALSDNDRKVIAGHLTGLHALLAKLYTDREPMAEAFDPRNVSQVAEVTSRAFDAVRISAENDRRARQAGMIDVVLAAVAPLLAAQIQVNNGTVAMLSLLSPEQKVMFGENLPKIATHAFVPFGAVFAAVSQKYPGITHETLAQDVKRIGYDVTSSKSEGLKVKIPLSAYVPPKSVPTMVKENAAKGSKAHDVAPNVG